MKKALSLFLTMTLIATMMTSLGFNSFGMGRELDFTNGKCGDNVSYSYDFSTGKLTISGTGEMEDYAFGDTGYGYEYGYKYDYRSPFKYTTIKSVEIKDGVTSVGNSAFLDCTELTSVIIADSIKRIGNYAFYNCQSLQNIAIGEGVKSIGESAFDNCESLKSVVFPDEIKRIGQQAFYKCSSLSEIIIPDGIESIEDWAFFDTSYYNDIKNWDAGVLYIGNHLIEVKNNKISDFSIKKGTKCIGDCVFKEFGNLTGIQIPYGVTSIGMCAFEKCTSLESIEIPASVKYIGAYAFNSCYKLKSITIPEGIDTISFSVFFNCYDLTSVKLPDSITSIEAYAFCECTSLTNVIIPDKVSLIDSFAFFGCQKLTNVIIPDSVKTIEYSAFGYCSDLTDVVIGNSVETIEQDAFQECEKLKRIVIPGSVTSIGYHVFENCNSLTDVYYTGSENQFKNITIYSDNEKLTNANIHYDSYLKVENPATAELGYKDYRCAHCSSSFRVSYIAPTGKLNLKHSARTVNAIKVQWNNVKSATGYQVQISTKDGKKWSTYATLKAGVTNYTFKKLAAGNNYKFRVRFFIKAPDGNNYFSPWSATLGSPTLPTGTTLTKLTSAKKAFNAQWKKNASVNGYQVQYGVKSNFSGAKTLTVKNAKTLKAAVKKLSAKKTYYVRIRTYKTISKVNYFSTWSKTYKVKTK